MSELFEIEIRSSVKSYTVKIGTGIVRPLVGATESIILVDEVVKGLYPWLLSKSGISIKAEERFKNLESVSRIIEQLRSLGASRGTRALAIGGGIVQDLATFSSSSYMRGISWDYCPTTLLGMVDSCIGGKSSINVGPYKNIVGNFYPPDVIYIDTEFCKSLSAIQLVEGLCEAVKICFAADTDAFEKYLALVGTEDKLIEELSLAEVIALTLSCKKGFIEEDEFDNGVRLLLNFGHTFGHALEGASNYRISHGIAVGLGMLASIAFSESYGITNANQPRIKLLVGHIRLLLKKVPDLGALFKDVSYDAALQCFKSDKKHSSDHYALIALGGDGFLKRILVPRNFDTEGLIKQAFKSLEQVIDEIQ